jgi:HEAT repeat protein
VRCEQARESLVEMLGEPETSLPEDVLAHVNACAACGIEAAEMQETARALGRLGEESSSERMRARFYTMLARESARVRPDAPAQATRRASGGLLSGWFLRPALQAGLLIAVLLAGVLLGMRVGPRPGSTQEIEALRAEMRSMSQAVTLSLLQHPSASERLRAIALCALTPPDDAIVDALLRVVADDPSANVRLAALDVLGSVPARPGLPAELIDSFRRQASPAVMAAMASLLLKMDGADAVEAVHSAASDDRLPESVRDYLQRLLAERGKAAGAGT